jgi:hypothetical protein
MKPPICPAGKKVRKSEKNAPARIEQVLTIVSKP